MGRLVDRLDFQPFCEPAFLAASRSRREEDTTALPKRLEIEPAVPSGWNKMTRGCREILILLYCTISEFSLAPRATSSLRAEPFIWRCVPPTGSFSCKSNSSSYEDSFETETQLKVSRKWTIFTTYATVFFLYAFLSGHTLWKPENNSTRSAF